MALVVRVEGVQKVLMNLKKAHKGLGREAATGLKRAGLFLQRASQKIVPVDTGALKGSAFTRAEGSGWDIVVQVGYTQLYSIFVHENLEAKHKTGKEAKYLERPLRENRLQILKIVRTSMDKGASKFGLPPTRNSDLWGGSKT